ncbi:MAG: TIGR04282 family arsenosugar biosynthesis glycosyltransferase [Gammaproteobacteria bacterium]|nr:TIGR04282 family arsenosugar biosynthesis glycosyltransferase [Gammaproteobacteria bacterium]
MPDNSRCLIIFTRAPYPGQVKKRLIPALGVERATRLYRDMIEKVLRTAGQLTQVDVQVWIAGEQGNGFTNMIGRRHHFPCYPQQGNDLGQRMQHAASSCLENYANVVLIGCDCPGLTPGLLEKAFRWLEENSGAVLGPAGDGGYYLIGLQQANPSIFDDIQWGTGSVADCTRERFRECGITWYELPVLRDVDRPEDLLASGCPEVTV